MKRNQFFAWLRFLILGGATAIAFLLLIAETAPDSTMSLSTFLAVKGISAFAILACGHLFRIFYNFKLLPTFIYRLLRDE